MPVTVTWAPIEQKLLGRWQVLDWCHGGGKNNRSYTFDFIGMKLNEISSLWEKWQPIPSFFFFRENEFITSGIRTSAFPP
jgi:hypothetical protein